MCSLQTSLQHVPCCLRKNRKVLSRSMEDSMALSAEVREKLQRRIDELKKRMQYDANDLDYETHLNMVRELQKIVNAK